MSPSSTTHNRRSRCRRSDRERSSISRWMSSGSTSSGSRNAPAMRVSLSNCSAVPDSPSPQRGGGNMRHISIEQAITDLRHGTFVIIVDDEDRENEGDLAITAEVVNFMARHGRGLICVAMTGERLDALELPLMVSPDQNSSGFGTAFTVSVEA